MKASASTLAIGLLLAAALPAGMALAGDPAEQMLIERANYWRAQHRPDLAGQILNKVLANNPTQPDALYQQGVLAMEQGDRGDAQRYFDRLRQLAPGDARAAELIGTARPAAVGPVAVTVAAPATSVTSAKPAALAPPAPGFVVASADSDDLIPAGKASAPAGAAAAVSHAAIAALAPAPAKLVQVASLPQTTMSDSDTQLPVSLSAMPLAGSSDIGITARAVQVAQAELLPPLPVGGYQMLGSLKPYSPSDTLETNIDRDLTRLELQSNPQLLAGFSFLGHSGQQGTGEFTEFGVPVQVSFSPFYTGTATIAVTPVHIDAGSVGPITDFGVNPMVIATGGVPTSSSQNASGVGLLGSYALGDFSGQFGTTPLGFPIVNFIGDVAYVPKFFGDTVSVRIEGLRQPVTDTVLSYAGTHATSLAVANANPVSPGAFGANSLWGGVVKTGPHITAFYDDQMYGAYAGAGVAWLTGTNVADNSVVDALLGAYFRPWKTDNWALRVGVSLYYTGYDKNLNGFTFGQGGYFSPQNFEGLGFPIEWTGHAGPWSWLASTTLGVQQFHASSSQVFPNNPNAQLAIETLNPNLATLSGQSSGVGFGFNLKGQVEYALDSTTSLGLAGSANNSNSYNEVAAQLYLRKTFDWFAPVAIKNDPASIAARDMPMSHL